MAPRRPPDLRCQRPTLTLASRKTGCLILSAVSVAAADSHNRRIPPIIPKPVSLEAAAGAFVITAATRVVADDAAGDVAGQLIDTLAPAGVEALPQVHVFEVSVGARAESLTAVKKPPHRRGG